MFCVGHHLTQSQWDLLLSGEIRRLLLKMCWNKEGTCINSVRYVYAYMYLVCTCEVLVSVKHWPMFSFCATCCGAKGTVDPPHACLVYCAFFITWADEWRWLCSVVLPWLQAYSVNFHGPMHTLSTFYIQCADGLSVLQVASLPSRNRPCPDTILITGFHTYVHHFI